MEQISLNDLTKWERRWMWAAAENANMSLDPGTKCGAVIVDPSGKRRISEGYNGLPQRIPDTKEILHNKGFKYSAVIHSEMNAILFARRDLTNHTMFVTGPPCDRCSAHIVQAGIARVYWFTPTMDYWSRWENESLMGRKIMTTAMLKLIEVTS